MDIVIDSLLDGAERATGAVAVIDVFRAFTAAAVALANGASRIAMVGTVEEALALRASGAARVCIGEVRGRRPDGFDFGNSPSELLGVDLRGAAVAQRTGAGTQGIGAARRAEHLYAASLVTAGATARALRAGAPAWVTLVAMGDNTVVRTDEDELCALHLRNPLEGRAGDPEAVRRVVLAGREAARFRDPAFPHLPPGDLDVAPDHAVQSSAVARADRLGRVRQVDHPVPAAAVNGAPARAGVDGLHAAVRLALQREAGVRQRAGLAFGGTWPADLRPTRTGLPERPRRLARRVRHQLRCWPNP